MYKPFVFLINLNGIWTLKTRNVLGRNCCSTHFRRLVCNANSASVIAVCKGTYLVPHTRRMVSTSTYYTRLASYKSWGYYCRSSLGVLFFSDFLEYLIVVEIHISIVARRTPAIFPKPNFGCQMSRVVCSTVLEEIRMIDNVDSYPVLSKLKSSYVLPLIPNSHFHSVYTQYYHFIG